MIPPSSGDGTRSAGKRAQGTTVTFTLTPRIQTPWVIMHLLTISGGDSNERRNA